MWYSWRYISVWLLPQNIATALSYLYVFANCSKVKQETTDKTKITHFKEGTNHRPYFYHLMLRSRYGEVRKVEFMVPASYIWTFEQITSKPYHIWSHGLVKTFFHYSMDYATGSSKKKILRFDGYFWQIPHWTHILKIAMWLKSMGKTIAHSLIKSRVYFEGYRLTSAKQVLHLAILEVYLQH